MEFSSWSVVKGDGAFRGLIVWGRVRMSDRKVVRFPAIFQIFRLFDHYVRVFFAFFFVGIRVIIVVEEGGGGGGGGGRIVG